MLGSQSSHATDGTPAAGEQHKGETDIEGILERDDGACSQERFPFAGVEVVDELLL